MSDKKARSEVYDLTGPGIQLTYRRRDGKLELAGDDHLLQHDALDAVADADPDVGLRLTATLLHSSRAGLRVMLTLLLPEVTWESGTTATGEKVSGVAVITRSHRNIVGDPPPVLHTYDVRPLEGTVVPRAPAKKK